MAEETKWAKLIPVARPIVIRFCTDPQKAAAVWLHMVHVLQPACGWVLAATRAKNAAMERERSEYYIDGLPAESSHFFPRPRRSG